MINIKNEVDAIFKQVVEWRRDFHMYPELGNCEKRTSAKVAETLRELDIDVIENVGGYGVVGILRGKNSDKTIALRADMDALPIQEENTFNYASRVKGVMHACGHDAHTAMLLGTAVILSKIKNQLNGNVKFVFQHAEEVGPNGGAKAMVKAGVLENPKVDVIIGQHLFPFLPSGMIKIGKGTVAAAADNITIKVFGKSGHGAEPHNAKDALLTSCQIVNFLQTIISRQIDPLDTAVITVGKIKSGSTFNVISDYAEMEGTVRTINSGTQDKIAKAIENVVEGIAKATETKCTLSYEKGIPAVVNNESVVDMIIRACSKFLPPESFDIMTKPIPGSEDFSNYLIDGVAGAYYWLGCALDGKEPVSNHHPKFDWDENAMKTGITAFTATVFEYFDQLNELY